MPLKCIKNGEEYFAFSVTDDATWESLRKDNKQTGCLRMHCCGSGVVLRTSKLGTRHFAHAARGECTSATETAEHLLAKMGIVRGIQDASWTALPEQIGRTASGEEWRADVLAVQGSKRVAFEVQWSRQTIDETRQRQNRYREAGVRGLWLFRQLDFPVEKDTPAFRLSFDPEAKAFTVQLASPNYNPEWSKRNDTDLWNQTIPLSRFVAGALTGRLRFAPALGQRMPLEVHTARIDCWRCKRETRIVLGLVFAASRVFPSCPDIHTSIYDMAEQLNNGVMEVMALIPPALLRQHGIGPVKMRWSKTEGGEYLSNGCIHCDALQGRFYDHDHWYDAAKTFELEAVFKPEWGTRLHLDQEYINRWLFCDTDIEPGVTLANK